MKLLIAPDSFKGSLTSLDVAKAIESGLKKVDIHTNTTILPMADGGEGTLTALIKATNGEVIKVNVLDSLGREITGYYGILGNSRTAVIELAVASGLPLLRQSELNPYVTSTYGTGQLINHALEKGIDSFIICLGGSATNDAGAGILKALGFRLLDKDGMELSEGGLALRNLAAIDDKNVNPSIRRATFQLACDVNNPFIGVNGATHVFGPQKGATVAQIVELEQALKVFADVVYEKTGRRIHDLKGAGAAGGTAGGLLAFLNASLHPGVEIVMEALKIPEILADGNIDLVITGEGKLDYQTGFGKVVAGLTTLANRSKIPVVAICGQVEMDGSVFQELGLTSAFSITNGPMGLDEAMGNASILLEHTSEQIYRLFLARTVRQ
ncbi:glycerate kinase family protein [Mesobacillus maritimus]|uniref:Glycerate kinase n=1 Tax=Mesobacillus maritimus TaxID=1643336 RepID=A0ABS7JZD3_9BACI|nr:glycerate kinase [Mesobacillus maritimus]MBY0095347.1 glycerate kinase [Mesobacillus maritimus]